ncbi:hypothetical protein KMZ15_01425 [Mycoavidus sp. HKI]|nr:hypothetical protein [Mycoavidus sp. HKI]UAW65058.1 hypothetical protein KMZ15_01425 [Mycoavidus sp. HKI]
MTQQPQLISAPLTLALSKGRIFDETALFGRRQALQLCAFYLCGRTR